MCLVKSNKCGYKCKIGLCYWKLVRCRWTIWALPRASVNSKSCINTCGINNLSYTRFWAMFLGRLYQVLQFFLLITFPYPCFSQEADHSCLLASLSCFLSFVDRIVNNYLHDRFWTELTPSIFDLCQFLITHCAWILIFLILQVLKIFVVILRVFTYLPHQRQSVVAKAWFPCNTTWSTVAILHVSRHNTQIKL